MDIAELWPFALFPGVFIYAFLVGLTWTFCVLLWGEPRLIADRSKRLDHEAVYTLLSLFAPAGLTICLCALLIHAGRRLPLRMRERRQDRYLRRRRG